MSGCNTLVKLAAVPLLIFAASPAPVAANADSQRFTILRDGNEVGVHEVRREAVAGQIRVNSSSRIDVRLLGLNLYRFRYQSREVWDDQGLLSLEVDVDDGGEPFNLSGERVSGRFEWTSDLEDGKHPLPLFPTNHWNPEVLEQDAVLNTLTGSLNRVRIEPQGREMLQLPSAQVPATRYQYQGELRLDSWYDAAGRWLGMRFEGRDGSTIEYLCSSCDAKVAM
jgi:hypothetical protein